MSDRIPQSSSVSRRRALLAIGTGVTVGLAGCSGDDGASTTTDGSTSTATDTATATATATETATQTPQPPTLQEQLDAVESATSKYADLQAALQDGFDLAGPYIPGTGWSVSNQDRVAAALQEGFDIEMPPLLTYVETESGLALGSVGYTGPASQVPQSPDLFNDGEDDATEEWRETPATTRVFADGNGSQTPPGEISQQQLLERTNWAAFSPPDQNLSAGDSVSLNWGSPRGKQGDRTERVADVVKTTPKLRTLNVWVHEDNPDGVFTRTNPRFVPSASQ